MIFHFSDKIAKFQETKFLEFLLLCLDSAFSLVAVLKKDLYRFKKFTALGLHNMWNGIFFLAMYSQKEKLKIRIALKKLPKPIAF